MELVLSLSGRGSAGETAEAAIGVAAEALPDAAASKYRIACFLFSICCAPRASVIRFGRSGKAFLKRMTELFTWSWVTFAVEFTLPSSVIIATADKTSFS